MGRGAVCDLHISVHVGSGGQSICKLILPRKMGVHVVEECWTPLLCTRVDIPLFIHLDPNARRGWHLVIRTGEALPDHSLYPLVMVVCGSWGVGLIQVHGGVIILESRRFPFCQGAYP